MSVIELHCWIIVPHDDLFQLFVSSYVRPTHPVLRDQHVQRERHRVGQHRRLPKLPLGLRTAPLHPAGHLHRRRHHLLREKRTLETVFEKETL